jgi:hypothetical protein
MRFSYDPKQLDIYKDGEKKPYISLNQRQILDFKVSSVSF